MYFPVFYCFKEVVQGSQKSAPASGSDAEAPTPATLGDSLPARALAKYQENFWKDNMAIWALWIPCDMVIYSAPLWLRLPLNHSVSLAWTMILSFMRG
jgi:hypothetical protein